MSDANHQPLFSKESLNQKLWNKILQKYGISAHQEQQFLQYLQLLLEENQKYNLTAITNVDDVLLDHFSDSLSVLKLYDMKSVASLVDVGSGAGFPGIPLAIMMPNVKICLIEVNLKKVHFLKLVIEKLNLQNISISSEDWRTFLRSAQEPVDLVIARASLPVEELLRIFKPSSLFKTATLIYWASKKWIPTEHEKEYLDTSVEYGVGQKQRVLCFFKIK